MNDVSIYKPKNLNSTEAKFVDSVVRKLVMQFRDLETNVESFKTTLAQFSETIIDHVDMSLERADIISKYYSDEKTIQPHNHLPGIVSVPQAYDISEVKVDNEKVTEINAIIEKLEDQRNIATRMLTSDYEGLVSSYNKAMILMQSLVESLISLESDLDF